MCVFKLLFWDAEKLHNWHWLSFVFACTDLICATRICLCVKDFMQCGHLCNLIILWIASSCTFNSYLVAKADPQSVHAWSFILRWMALWCRFRRPFAEKAVPHSPQIWSLILSWTLLVWLLRWAKWHVSYGHFSHLNFFPGMMIVETRWTLQYPTATEAKSADTT